MSTFKPKIWGLAPSEQQVPLRLPLLGQQLSTIMTHQLARLDRAAGQQRRAVDGRSLIAIADQRSVR